MKSTYALVALPICGALVVAWPSAQAQQSAPGNGEVTIVAQANDGGGGGSVRSGGGGGSAARSSGGGGGGAVIGGGGSRGGGDSGMRSSGGRESAAAGRGSGEVGSSGSRERIGDGGNRRIGVDGGRRDRADFGRRGSDRQFSSRDRDDRFRHRGRRIVWGPGVNFWFYDGYYYGDCDWLRRRAQVTGSRYWWDRYQRCRYSG